MTSWSGALALILLACAGPASPRVEPRATGHADAPTAAAPPDAGGETIAGDPPEPTAPVVECAFTPVEHCAPGVPTRRALQPAPFQWCAPTAPARETGSLYPTGDARFSAARTRAARAADPEACCYVEYVTSACD